METYEDRFDEKGSCKSCAGTGKMTCLDIFDGVPYETNCFLCGGKGTVSRETFESWRTK